MAGTQGLAPFSHGSSWAQVPVNRSQMTEADVDGKPDAKVGRRNRVSIYGDRKVITIRMSESLNEQLMAHCNQEKIPANSYVVGLIKALLSNPSQSPDLRRTRAPESRVMVSIRLDPSLHERMTAFCESLGVSANALVLWLVKEDLRLRYDR